MACVIENFENPSPTLLSMKNSQATVVEANSPEYGKLSSQGMADE